MTETSTSTSSTSPSSSSSTSSSVESSPAPSYQKTLQPQPHPSQAQVRLDAISGYVSQLRRRVKNATGATPVSKHRPMPLPILPPQTPPQLQVPAALPQHLRAQELWRRFEAKKQPSISIKDYTKRCVLF